MKKTFFLFAAVLFAAVSMAQTPTVSASKVTLKYCKTTYGAKTVVAESLPTTVDGFEFAEEGTYVRKIGNVRGCDSVVTYTIELNNGSLSGVFTAGSDGHKIQFSKGNLMFRACDDQSHNTLFHAVATGGTKYGIWAFHDTQYESYHDDNANLNPANNQTQWFDMFSFATSGVNENVAPNARSGSFDNVTDLEGSNYDWGKYNAISNGGNTPGAWRTPTYDEFNYIITYSTKAFCIINNQGDEYKGVILLPDNWVKPAKCDFTANDKSNYYYTTGENNNWNDMEAAGAVFLISDGYVESAYIKGSGYESLYHTCTLMQFNPNYNTNSYSFYENPTPASACHIRLVKDAK